MKQTGRIFFALLFTAIASFSQTKWSLDKSHSEINFTVVHMTISEITGNFGDFSVQFESLKEDFSDAKVDVAIKAKSINTKNERRDGHLRSEDFFNAEKDSIIIFKSTSFVKTGKETYSITGDLTMRGVTKQVILDTKFKGSIKNPRGQMVVAFKAATTINRKEWGLNWNRALEAGGWLVSDNVDITIIVELVQG